ncbi:MAG: toxin-antitoxin system HicB family antitoxin [Pyrinomonadaceae bacterium]|nr:toxin-antitoxin system HicB family antitoxin [Pyrinomonadaceae bacterium]
MSTISLRLPESLHRQLRELAKREGISINQLAASALGEKVTALLTEDYLEHRANRGDRAKFLKALDKVKRTPPDENDVR